jgi:hypothetical protein
MISPPRRNVFTPSILTDPSIEDEFSRYERGAERIVLKPLLCISISMVFERTRAYYKLIAGVMEAQVD